MNSFVTPDEVAAARKRLGLAPQQTDVGFQSASPEPPARQGFTPAPLAPTPLPAREKPTRGGFSGLVKRLTTPLIDVPNLPGGFVGDIVEGGVESMTSPIGLLSTALIPVTGGSSLGLRGAAGIAARAGTRLGAEAVAGGVAGKASEVAADKLKDAPAAVRIAGSLGAAVLAGGATGTAASRAFRGGAEAAAKSAAATVEGMSAQSLGGFTPEADEVIAALGEAGKRLKDPTVRQQLKAERGAVLSGRINAGYRSAAQTSGTADELIQARAGALRGQLPALDFPELSIKPETIETLRQTVLESDRLSPLDQINAHDGLMKALVGQTVPAQHEIRLLERVFGPAFSKALIDVKPYSLGRFVSDAINLPRALIASSDLSFPLNQGLLAAGADPKEWAKSVKVAGRAFADPVYAKEMDDWVRGVTGSDLDKAISALAQKVDLPFTGSAATSEELFHQSDKLMSTLFKSNAAGALLTASERGYVAPGNYLRYQLFNKTLKKMVDVRPGEDVIDAIGRIPYQDVKRLSDTVSVLTGRSTLKALKGNSKYASTANAFLFAPNFLMSRLQAPLLPFQSLKAAVQQDGLKALANPVALYQADPVLALQSRALGGFIAQGTAALVAMRAAKEAGLLPDFNVEFDPRSSNFGKGKVGSQAFDFWGGYSQIARSVARAVSGQQKTSAGNIVDLPRDNAIWDQFVRSKVAPFPGMAWDVITGTTYTGERVSAKPDAIDSAIASRFLPLAMQDIIKGYTEGGAGAGLAATPAFFGGRVTSFSSLGTVRNGVAQERFGKPFSELDQAQREQVNNHSKVLDKQREWDLVSGETFNKEVENINFERARNENVLASRYLSQIDDVKTFADGVEEQQLRAAVAREKAAERFGIKPTAKTSLLDQGLQQWQSLYDQADIGAPQGVQTGQIDWDRFAQLEAALFKNLTPEQVRFIEERHATPHDPSVQWYFNNKKYINESGYYGIADSVFAKSRAAKEFASYGELLAAADFANRTQNLKESARLKSLLKPVEMAADAQKEGLRRKDPNLDAALIAIGRASKPQTPAAAKLLKQ